MNILLRLFCSVDVSVGMLFYVLISCLFHEPPHVLILLVSVIGAHLPDLDLLPFLVLRRHIKTKRPGHWVYGHHPLFVIPVTVVLVVIIVHHVWPGHEFYLAILVAVTTLAHFVHDSVQHQGLHWFSPFSWTHYSFSDGLPRRVPDEYISQFYDELAMREVKASVNEEILFRITRLSSGELVFFVVSLSALLLFFILK